MSKLFIIGNGFDLKHGIPARYSDFAKFVEGTNLNLFQNLESVLLGLSTDSLWSNFEDAFATQNIEKLTKDIKNNIYNKRDNPIGINYDDLKMGFRDWVISLKKYIAVTAISKKYNFEKTDVFLTFNYTDTLEKIYHIDREKTCHIHGYFDDNDIVGESLFTGYIYGHGKEKYELKIDLEDEYLKQDVENIITSYKKDFQIDKLSCFISKLKLTEINDIFVLGHSLALVDKLYFSELVKGIPKAIWNIGYFDDSDYNRKIYHCHELGIIKPHFFYDR